MKWDTHSLIYARAENEFKFYANFPPKHRKRNLGGLFIRWCCHIIRWLWDWYARPSETYSTHEFPAQAPPLPSLPLSVLLDFLASWWGRCYCTRPLYPPQTPTLEVPPRTASLSRPTRARAANSHRLRAPSWRRRSQCLDSEARAGFWNGTRVWVNYRFDFLVSCQLLNLKANGARCKCTADDFHSRKPFYWFFILHWRAIPSATVHEPELNSLTLILSRACTWTSSSLLSPTATTGR